MKPNKIERLKAQCHPYDFQAKITQLDLHNLSEEDRFYLKNYGIYNIKLSPDRFMLRIRLLGGRVSVTALEQILHIAKVSDLEVVLTARAQMELHGLRASNVLQVWQQLHAYGLTTLQTLTDNFRNIVCDPYDGVAQSNQVEVYPLMVQMQALFLDNPAWMGMLPRKFNTAICGTATTPYHFFGNDLYFALAKKGDIWGFNLYLGGKNSEVAQCADIFARPQEVPALFEAVAKAYKAHGLRGTRAKTRLYHLLEVKGVAWFREAVEALYGERLACAGECVVSKAPLSSHTPLKEGYGYVVESHFGTLSLQTLERVITYASTHACEVRIGVDQNLHLIGLPMPEAPFPKQEGASHITACAGSRYCALSLWEIKTETAYLPLQKIEAHHIQVGFSGCLKGCGRHHHCDIGLVGLRTNAFGPTQKAARLFLGGQYSSGNAPARLIFPSVPLKHLRSLLDVIIETFEKSEAEDFEHFSRDYLNGHTPYFVMVWFLAQCYLKAPPKLTKESEAVLYKKLKACEDFPKDEGEEPYIDAIKTMTHALWDEG